MYLDWRQSTIMITTAVLNSMWSYKACFDYYVSDVTR